MPRRLSSVLVVVVARRRDCIVMRRRRRTRCASARLDASRCDAPPRRSRAEARRDVGHASSLSNAENPVDRQARPARGRRPARSDRRLHPADRYGARHRPAVADRGRHRRRARRAAGPGRARRQTRWPHARSARRYARQCRPDRTAGAYAGVAHRAEPVSNSMSDASLNLVGMRVNLSHEVQPLLDRTVDERIKELETRLRDDPFLERAVQREWTKLCRSRRSAPPAPGCRTSGWSYAPSVPSPRSRASTPRPSRSCRDRSRDAHRPEGDKPDCPFPATLEIVPQSRAGPH